MAGPPPLLRDDRLSLELLGRMARTFDQISAKDGGRTWPATDFVRWLAAEYQATAATYNRGPGQPDQVDEAA